MKAKLLAAAMVVGLSVAGASQSVNANIIVPGSLANVEGNIGNAWPFNIGLFSQPSMRYQQIYDSSEFGSGSVSITGLAFRPDGDDGDAFGPTMLPNMTVTLSTTSQAVDGLSTTFANNIGGDVVTVFSGTLTLSSSDTGAGPRDFDIWFDFQTPFQYDPNMGNLLLDVTNPTSTTTTQFDAHSATDSVSRLFEFNSASATASFQDTFGLVTLFKTATIPEPGTLALFGLGLAGLGFARRRKAA